MNEIINYYKSKIIDFYTALDVYDEYPQYSHGEFTNFSILFHSEDLKLSFIDYKINAYYYPCKEIFYFREDSIACITDRMVFVYYFGTDIVFRIEM